MNPKRAFTTALVTATAAFGHANAAPAAETNRDAVQPEVAAQIGGPLVQSEIAQPFAADTAPAMNPEQRADMVEGCLKLFFAPIAVKGNIWTTVTPGKPEVGIKYTQADVKKLARENQNPECAELKVGQWTTFRVLMAGKRIGAKRVVATKTEGGTSLKVNTALTARKPLRKNVSFSLHNAVYAEGQMAESTKTWKSTTLPR